MACSQRRIYAYCYVEILDVDDNIVVSDFGNAIRYQNAAGSLASTSIPVPKGYKVKIVAADGVSLCAFYPMKGV